MSVWVCVYFKAPPPPLIDNVLMVESRWWVFTIKFNQHFCFNTVRIKHPGNKISPTDQKAQPGLTITGLSHNPNWHMRELWTTEVMLSAPTLTGERAESAHEPGSFRVLCPVFFPAHHTISNRRGSPRADQERRHRSCLFWTLNDQESCILILPCGRKH